MQTYKFAAAAEVYILWSTAIGFLKDWIVDTNEKTFLSADESHPLLMKELTFTAPTISSFTFYSTKEYLADLSFPGFLCWYVHFPQFSTIEYLANLRRRTDLSSS